jgi:hypothetical protein
MEATKIHDILMNITGDAKGIKADDLLLILFRRVRKEKKREYWISFREVLIDLWSKKEDPNISHAIAAAAAFVARLKSEEKPDDADSIVDFLMKDESINPNIQRPQDWMGIVSALRILTHFGLGDALFWRKQLKFWLVDGFQIETHDFSVFDGLVQAVRGVVATDGLTDRDFAIIFVNALKMSDFPALEVYSALVEETLLERNQAEFNPERIQHEIMEVFSDIQEGYYFQEYSKNLKVLNDVINAWSIDVLNLVPPKEKESSIHQYGDKQKPWKVLQPMAATV